ncbi:tetratricopeptide repeat protein [Aerosakkonema funiforme]|uniref:PLDc N-terminal domain-containing protein n=2 Tax=Oscillatoriophycideae TaxID=1301283 RepID=A0A926ZL20_9CYAN|nr:PLD nuclease N-terminal domain-containing protein [Aerosakkonema funiforme]MBD2184626.1 PLDc N-terminal domain-containing protein [Aerosakkonema funiforme FACHB-1375]
MLEFVALLSTGFWLFMIYDCVQNERERNTWLWILIFLNFPGAVIYFLTRKLPRMDVTVPKYFTRWTRSRELWIAEADAKNIGKAHQFVILGNLLSEMGMLERAEIAYKTALEKEPDHTQALWGAAFVDMQNKKFGSAKEYLEKLLKLEPDHKYGDGSLAYAKTLVALQDWEAAKAHLEKDIRQWSHPEAYIMMATIQSQEGNPQEARRYVETMLSRVRGSSYFHYKRNRHWVNKGEKFLKSLPK